MSAVANPAKDTAAIFPSRFGSIINIDDVSSHLRIALESQKVPFSFPLPFRDRLGLFLGEYEPHFRGQFPQPDVDSITVYPFCALPKDAQGDAFRFHARGSFHGHPKFSFFEAEGEDGESWFGQLWLLFQCQFQSVTLDLALVSWLKDVPSVLYSTRKRSFTWNSLFADCVEVAHFIRPVTMLPSFVQRSKHTATVAATVYHLMD